MLNKKVLWFFCTLVFGFAFTIFYIGFQRDYKIYREGKLVTVVLTEVPNQWRATSEGKMWFNYNGDSYYIFVHGNVNNAFHVEDTIQLRYLKGYEHYFQLPHDNEVYSSAMGMILMVVLILVCIYNILLK